MAGAALGSKGLKAALNKNLSYLLLKPEVAQSYLTSCFNYKFCRASAGPFLCMPQGLAWGWVTSPRLVPNKDSTWKFFLCFSPGGLFAEHSCPAPPNSVGLVALGNKDRELCCEGARAWCGVADVCSASGLLGRSLQGTPVPLGRDLCGSWCPDLPSEGGSGGSISASPAWAAAGEAAGSLGNTPRHCPIKLPILLCSFVGKGVLRLWREELCLLRFTNWHSAGVKGAAFLPGWAKGKAVPGRKYRAFFLPKLDIWSFSAMHPYWKAATVCAGLRWEELRSSSSSMPLEKWTKQLLGVTVNM